MSVAVRLRLMPPTYLQSSNAAGATALSVRQFSDGPVSNSNYRVAVPSWRHFAVDRGRSEGEASSWLISLQNVKKSKKRVCKAFSTHTLLDHQIATLDHDPICARQITTKMTRRKHDLNAAPEILHR
jgi:hypothetical protein